MRRTRQTQQTRQPRHLLPGYQRTQAKAAPHRLWIHVSVPVAIIGVLIATVAFGLPRMQSHAAANKVNGNCTLIVPANPLTAQGLATPYQLVATNPAKGQCKEANKTQAAFVQGAVIDPATGAISIYDPLVIDQGTQPAAQPVTATLPQGGIVALWFGFNGTNLKLQDSNGSLQAGQCVNGVQNSIFGQFAYCNAPAFFQAANQAIQAGKLVPPPLGMGKDGKTCPSVRDFGLVDMDQSDNVTSTYLITANGQVAQATTANGTALQNAQMQVNGSDNRLLAIALDGALGCTPWMASDLADPGKMTTALPLNELQAAAQQAKPIALVPIGDPMVLVNNTHNLDKLNAYRLGVDQPMEQVVANASTATYCASLRMIAPSRMQLDEQFTAAQPSVDPAVANSLLTFLEQRFVMTYEAKGLNCQGLLNMADPITVQTDANGITIDGTINGVMNGGQGTGTGTGTTPNCVINGTTVVGCAGSTTIGTQTCTFAFDTKADQVNITCPKGVVPTQ